MSTASTTSTASTATPPGATVDSDDEEAETLAIVRTARAAVPPRRPPPRRAQTVPAAGRGAGLDVCAPCEPTPCVHPAAAIAALERRLGHAVQRAPAEAERVAERIYAPGAAGYERLAGETHVGRTRKRAREG